MPGPHLELLVKKAGSHRVELVLDGGGYVNQSFGVVTFSQDRYAHFPRVLRELEGLEAGDGEESELRLRSRGERLFRKLLPVALQTTLTGLARVGLDLQIVSDDASIPWECFRFPGERGGDGVAGLFWGEAFAITRLPPGKAPRAGLTLRRMAWVENGEDPLPHAEGERAAIQEVWGDRLEIVPVAARYVDIREQMIHGPFDAWHFACHGAATGEDADAWYLVLEGGGRLTPDELPAEAEAMRHHQPFVFMNACDLGRGGLSVCGMGGWAPNLLQLGTSAFIAPMWSIRDRQAAAFSAAVHRHLAAGATIGEAARLSRLDREPGDPSRLAYVVFADPAAGVDRRAGDLAEAGDGAGTAEPEAGETAPTPAAPSPRRRRVVGPVPPLKDEPPQVPARPRASEKEKKHRDGSQLLAVPGGSYPMGSDDPDLPEVCGPRHLVRLTPFWIARFPVTNEQYGRFLAENPQHPPPQYWDDADFNGPRQPVVGVSWHDARAYCRWAGLELPTEAQWEAAARGLEGRLFPWGDDEPTRRRANYGEEHHKTTPVDAYPAGRGPFHTLDQAGNVWEWCLDVWDPLAYRTRGSRAVDPVCERKGWMRVVRGGSWLNHSRDLRAAYRDGNSAGLRQNQVGFRCVLNPRDA